MKLLCVLLPHFPLQCETRRRHEVKGRPAVVTYAVGSQKLVLDYSPGLEGLQDGMPLQQALSLHGEVELIQADIPHYWQVFGEILDALEGKSPLVEGSELGCAYIGMDGMQALYPDDNTFVDSVREVIPPTFVTQMGIARGKFLAYLAALSSSSDGYQILMSDASAFLRDLSCDVLPVSAKSKSRLHDFGIHTLGQAASLPLGPLQAQFSPEGRRISDFARGYDDTPLYPRSTEEVIEESAELPSAAVSLEAILVTLEFLLSCALARDSLKGRGIRSLNLWTKSWGSGYWERHIHFKEPTTDIKSIILRVKLFLENSPQPGPVEEMGIKLTRLGYGRGRQKSLFSEVRAKDHLIDDIRQMELRMGSPQVFKIKEVEPWSRIPERRYALAPAGH